MILTEARRIRLAARAPAAALRELARDESVTVRAALALNQSAPDDVNDLLSHDPDQRVRTLIARKLAGLLRDEATAERASLWLLTLAEDEAERVRSALAEEVKALGAAPRALILALARDRDISVCGPVIRLSPVLTDTDLVALVVGATAMTIPRAVAARPGIGEAVSEAVVASADEDAISALLANDSARIREATLDALAATSISRPDWQAGLVGRSVLPPRVARTLSGLITDHLLETLVRRADLPEEVMERVRHRLARTPLARTPLARTPLAQTPLAQTPLAPPDPETALIEAIRLGDHTRGAAALAEAAGLALTIVERAVLRRSVKGITALVWKAGLTASLAVAAQRLLAGAGPGALIVPDRDGGFVLSEAEMNWQLALLDDTDPGIVIDESTCPDPIR